MQQLNDAFAALADPTRRGILSFLAKGEATVSQLVDQFDLTQPTISAHIKTLERAGLILRISPQRGSVAGRTVMP